MVSGALREASGALREASGALQVVVPQYLLHEICCGAVEPVKEKKSPKDVLA